MKTIFPDTKICLIRQPAGLGDIILCLKIASFFIDKGYKVVWPVIEQYYETITKYFKTKDIIFCKESDDFPLKNIYQSPEIRPVEISGNLYLPLQHADRHFQGESALKSKFKILGLDHNNWQDYFSFRRNEDKEKSLYEDVLGLEENEDFIFVNGWYGSPPSPLKKDIKIEGKNKIVEMSTLKDYSILDWCRVIEKAKEIHCVDTSLFYIIEMLNLRATTLVAYSKFNPPNYMHTQGLFNSPWLYK